MLESARMLRFNVHMDGALVLLGKVTMGALKLAGLGADILERHGDCWLTQGNYSIFLKLATKNWLQKVDV
jgi:hypothetical protein